jgi:pilus assembly protein CpaB
MPRLPGWAWLLLAFGFATLATYIAFGYIKGRTAVQPVKATIKVVRTIDKVEKGEILSAKQLKIVVLDLDKEKPPENADYFSDEKKVEGRRAVESLLPNTLITAENTEPVVPGMAGRVKHNQRAMTVKVDEASGVAGFLTPGNRVDVVVVMDKGEFNKDPISKILFNDLNVLGTGQIMVTPPEDKSKPEAQAKIVPTVTLEVTPEQGERLALAAQEGRISLVLRGQGDQLPVETPGADVGMFKLVPKMDVPPPKTTALLGPNQRAVTVKVDEASGVAGFLTPGNRVDVVVVMDKEEWKKYPLAKILFQDLKVLGTDQKKQTVTLAVTPQEGVDLTWASQAGRISLVLRDSDEKLADKNEEKLKVKVKDKTLRADAGRFFGQSEPPPARRTVQLIRGIEWAPEEPLDTK